jgi:hypothetical protein
MKVLTSSDAMEGNSVEWTNSGNCFHGGPGTGPVVPIESLTSILAPPSRILSEVCERRAHHSLGARYPGEYREV